jgi:hypothetical protein
MKEKCAPHLFYFYLWLTVRYLVECDKHSSLAEHTELDIRNVMEPAAQSTMSYFKYSLVVLWQVN